MNRFGARAASQYAGPGGDLVTIVALIAPEIVGSYVSIDRLIDMAYTVDNWPLVDGMGYLLGHYYIEAMDLGHVAGALSRTQDVFHPQLFEGGDRTGTDHAAVGHDARVGYPKAHTFASNVLSLPSGTTRRTSSSGRVKLVRDLGLDPDQLHATCLQRSGQQAVEALYPNLTIEANFGQMRQADCRLTNRYHHLSL